MLSNITTNFFRISYLRTYEHVGTAEVLLCGKHLITIDGLWKNSKLNNVSLSYTRTISIKKSKVKAACDDYKFAGENEMVDITIISPTFLPIDDPKPRDNTSSPSYTVSYNNRGRAKFKLLGVQLC